MTHEEYAIEKFHQFQKQMSELERFMKAQNTTLCRVMEREDYENLHSTLKDILFKYSNK